MADKVKALSKGWSTAVPDWEKRILAGTSLVPDLPLFEDEADRAVRIFGRLRVPDIEGTPKNSEVCEQWVFDLVRAIFGSYDPVAKRRMIREFFLLIPKKNGKSSIAAAIMVTAAIMNKRPLAELLLIAPTKKIAGIAFKQAWGIINLDKQLKAIFHPQGHIGTITHRITGAAIIIKAADTDVITGSKATFILIDETHEFAKKASAENVFLEIRGSLASRPDGFMIQITTQSKSEPSGVFKAELAMARDVRDGLVDLPLLPILYELPRKMATDGVWKERSTWKLVNPNLGKSVDEKFLVDELTKAERKGIEALALFASQHFNVEIGMGLRTDRWAGADFWQNATDKALAGCPRDEALDMLIVRCDVIVVGIDGGGADDMLGAVFLGREKGSRDWLAVCRAWVHEIALKRRKEIEPIIRDFEKEGTMRVIPDDSDEDIRAVVDMIAQVRDAALLGEGKTIGVDRIGITSVLDELENRGFELQKRVEPINQGWPLSDMIKTCERRLAKKSLRHDGSGLMRWCVANAKVEARGNAVMVTKQVAGTAKIDPVVALYNASKVMAMNPVAETSVYQDRGLLWLGG